MISHDKILLKIEQELALAKQSPDQAKLKEHIRAISLLTDLILDTEEEHKPTIKKTVSEELELRTMMGDRYQSQNTEQPSETYDNPNSLLDF
ncbi:YwdI family protein [Amphibacillus jilinensis]|uniref:YwdI family protein n=1 Tax=Amphibacillus jilinensis TaxID=1216008 RepID=UPI0002EBF1DC|nr:YwdI family protein [Amphibacillus jilinensis]